MAVRSVLFCSVLQAWLRVSRAELVVEMSSEALRVLKSKIRHTEFAIAQFSNNNKTVTVVSNVNTSKEDEKIIMYADNSLPQPSEICQSVAEVVESDANFSSLSGMLAQMDVVCNASLRTFQSLLPEVQSRTFAQRRITLLGILNKYSQLYLREEPSPEEVISEELPFDLLKAQKCSDDDAERGKFEIASAAVGRSTSSASDDLCLKWEQYSAWYSERRYAMLEIEKEFSSFIEDEREREGRLLKKWFSLSPPPTSTSSSSSAIRKSDNTNAKPSVSGSSSSNSSSSVSSSSSAKDLYSAFLGKSDADSKAQAPPMSMSASTGSTNNCREGASPTNLTASDTVKEGQSTSSGSGSGSGSRSPNTAGTDLPVSQIPNVKPVPQPSERTTGARSTGTAVFCTVPPGSLYSPRSVTAFVEYFCSYYVSSPYRLGSNRVLGEALKALVEVRSCILAAPYGCTPSFFCSALHCTALCCVVLFCSVLCCASLF